MTLEPPEDLASIKRAQELEDNMNNALGIGANNNITTEEWEESDEEIGQAIAKTSAEKRPGLFILNSKTCTLSNQNRSVVYM
jgi:hypothetical protein